MGSVAAGMVCVNGTDSEGGSMTRLTSGTCDVEGAVVCNADGMGFGLCDHGGVVDMGRVAEGTRCIGGEIVAA
jgi:hypothetical protein